MSIDGGWNEVLNLNQEKNTLACNTRQSVALFVFCFKHKSCAKMMISLCLQNYEFTNENIENIYYDVQGGYEK